MDAKRIQLSSRIDNLVWLCQGIGLISGLTFPVLHFRGVGGSGLEGRKDGAEVRTTDKENMSFVSL